MRRFLTVIFLSLFCILGVAVWTWFTLPDVTRINDCIVTSMHRVQLCPTQSRYAPLRTVSPHVINAVVVSEDASFFWHDGFDINEIVDSAKKNWQKGEWARGGSTITQQLAKNVYLTPEKSLLRKLREAMISIQLERYLTKHQILEKYLNVVEFGPGLYGIKDAARHYFRKPPLDLNILESVFLAFLLPDPKTYARSFDAGKLSTFAQKRVRALVERLLRFKKITPFQRDVAVDSIAAFPWHGLDADTQFILRASG